MLGKEIKKYLTNRGIRQTFISEKTGISKNTLNAMLNGNRRILVEEYFLICKVLEVPVDKFISKTA